MHSNRRTAEDLHIYTTLQKANDEIIITAEVPEPDDHALQTYTNNEDIDDAYRCSCSYLLVIMNQLTHPPIQKYDKEYLVPPKLTRI